MEGNIVVVEDLHKTYDPRVIGEEYALRKSVNAWLK